MKIAMFYGDKRNHGDYDNGVWMDILKIPYIEKIEEAGNYDVIIRTLWLEATGWSQEIRRKFPHVKQIGLSDHPLSSQISKLSADRQYAYLFDLQHLDGLMALTEEERQWYATALPSKPVIKGGLPFPFDTYEERYGMLREQERQYVGLGVGASDNDRNFISNVLVFQRLRLENPNLKGVFLSVPTSLIPYCSYLCEKFPGMYIQERTNMDDFYAILTQCKVVLSLADRNTPGRIQGEAAFFEIPVVGSNRLELQNELFPALSVSPYQLITATQLVADFVERGVDGRAKFGAPAREKLKKYNYYASKRKFNSLLRQIT